MHPQPRPRWRKKRWLAALLLWLLIAYPLSLGPAMYLIESGRMPTDAYVAFAPAMQVQDIPGVGRAYAAYLMWWWNQRPPDDPHFLPPPVESFKPGERDLAEEIADPDINRRHDSPPASDGMPGS